MKKTLSLLLALVFAAPLMAHPIGQETARSLAQSFVRANFDFTRQSSTLELVMTARSDKGEACYYIYNVGETGFVILAADDCVRPVIGYSSEGTFNPDDMAPALADYLEKTRLYIMNEAKKGAGNAQTAADWEMLRRSGRMVSRHGGRADSYLVSTKWNQNYPYNYFCPEANGGPGGRCYAGCVATAAAQLMKYWNHPVQGQGSYTYTPADNPQFGPLTANFGETTYDWDNMPESVSANSPQAQIEAVGRLIYHVGVSVDMNYRPTSSGAVTGKLCQTMPSYFFYTDQMQNLYREEYTHEDYMQLIINAIDMDWPMVHRGGGHAYVLDGYNDNDMVHFNWGWSGSSDGWFNVDNHDYAEDESVIYNYVPAEIYAATPDKPTDMAVEPTDDNSLTATVTWKNPTVTLTGVPLEAIEQIVVERNGKVVYVSDEVTPGAEMSIVDETIPCLDAYDYAVYAIVDGKRGASALEQKVLVGPTCNWKIIMQSTAFQGWNGGYVSLYSSAGTEITRLTLANSTPVSLNFPVPVGQVSFGWTAPQTSVNNITINLKDADNNSVFTYSGNTNGLTEGIFLSANNNCGNDQTCLAPYRLTAEMVEGDAVLTWETDGDAPEYGYNVYRDGQLFALVNAPEARTFVDEGITEGHCYTMTALGLGGETDHSNETCASSGDCLAPTDFWFEYVGANYKVKLTWEKPDPHDGLTGYYLFRKFGEDGTYERVKLLGASATNYTDSGANQQGDYYYRLYAYYSQSDCTSSPASIKGNDNLFYLHVYYSPTDVEETDAPQLNLYPNPADNVLRLECEGMTQVVVSNVLGQVAFQQNCEGKVMEINTTDMANGLYLVTIQTKQGVVSRRVSIVH